MFITLIVMMIYASVQTHQIIYVNYIQFFGYQLYLYKAVFNKNKPQRVWIRWTKICLQSPEIPNQELTLNKKSGKLRTIKCNKCGNLVIKSQVWSENIRRVNKILVTNKKTSRPKLRDGYDLRYTWYKCGCDIPTNAYQCEKTSSLE